MKFFKYIVCEQYIEKELRDSYYAEVYGSRYKVLIDKLTKSSYNNKEDAEKVFKELYMKKFNSEYIGDAFSYSEYDNSDHKITKVYNLYIKRKLTFEYLNLK